MSTQSSTIVQRLWNYCNILRDDEVEKELDGALPCGDDMVRAEMLRPHHPASQGHIPLRFTSGTMFPKSEY